MRLLYWISYLLCGPFMICAGVAQFISCVMGGIGGIIHDATTAELWAIMHRKQCARLRMKGLL